MTNVTIQDVAALAGVSIKTVSRVVNDEPNVRQSTRDKVNRAIARLDYRPNLSARNLASQRSHLIVLVYDDPGEYEAHSAGYVIRMQDGALRACRRHGHELVIHPCRYLAADAGLELGMLIRRMRPDGVIIAAPVSNVAAVVDAVAGAKTPFVCLSPGVDTPGRMAVATNDREACAEMTRYLASLGHRRIGFVSGNPDHRAVTHRLPGYLDGLRDSGLDPAPELVAPGDNSLAAGEAAAETLLGLGEPPTAIFAANDDMAAGVLRVAYRRGLQVPGDLSVAGFDDSPLARLVFPALTTVRQPLMRMAETAVQALVDAADGATPRKGVIAVESSLVVRDSTGPAPERRSQRMKRMRSR